MISVCYEISSWTLKFGVILVAPTGASAMKMIGYQEAKEYCKAS